MVEQEHAEVPSAGVRPEPSETRPAGLEERLQPAPVPPQARPRGGTLPEVGVPFRWLAGATAAVVLAVRLFGLTSRQNEVYGDVMIVYEYVRRILDGEWPSEYVLSVGPLYQYLIAPLVGLVGLDYNALKLATVVTSLGVLLATFALVRRLADRNLALLATFIAGVSSWLLIFSRLGNLQIMMPLLAMAALWLAVRADQAGRRIDLIACAVVSTLGLYVYAPAFVLPGVVLPVVLWLYWTNPRARRRDLWYFAAALAIGALPFALYVLRDPALFTDGYLGSKLVAGGDVVETLLGNLGRAALAFHVRGDQVFRSNPAYLPHLDVVSGLLFLAGIVYWVQPARRRWAPVLLVPFVLLQVPSLVVVGVPGEVPSAARTLAAAPIAYVLVASGLAWLVQTAQTRLGRPWLAGAAAGLLVMSIFSLNVDRYFKTYLGSLQYHDVPIGYLINEYIDRLPPATQVYIVGCCWADALPDAFYKGLATHPENLHVLAPGDLGCDLLQTFKTPAVVIWNPREPLPASSLESCRQWLPAQQYYSGAGGWPVFSAAPLILEAPSPGAGGNGRGELQFIRAQLHGEAVVLGVSPTDIGSAPDVLDGNIETLARGRNVNPMVIEIRFQTPREVHLVALDLGTMSYFAVRVDTTDAAGVRHTTTRTFVELPPDPHVDISLPAGVPATVTVHIEIEDYTDPGDAGYHTHVREVDIR